MITKKELRRIITLHRQIARGREQLEYLNEKATSIPSGISDGERIQRTRDNDAGKYIEAATDLARELSTAEADLEALQVNAATFIRTIEHPLAKKVMTMRYMNCYRWEEISELLGYVDRYLRQLERDATSALE